MTSNLFNNRSAVSESTNFNSFESRISVSNSLTDPKAMLKKYKNSFGDFLPAPSAMFDGIEMAALLICDVIPNHSLRGNFSVAKYTSRTKSKLYFQASNFLCGF